MKVAVISRSDALGGGASRIAVELAGGLADRGITAHHYHLTGTSANGDISRRLESQGLGQKLRGRALKLARTLGASQGIDLGLSAQLAAEFVDHDIIHFHDHADCIPMRTIGRLAQDRRVIFTCHDFLHATGGCIYPMECTRYRASCGHCPQAESLGRFDFTSSNLKAGREAARQAGLHYVYPSEWLRRTAGTSLGVLEKSEVIPNGFDERPYKFRQKAEARKMLGLDSNRLIVCISAHYLSAPRKGAIHAFRALRAAKDLKALVLLIGKPEDSLEHELYGCDFWCAGFVESRERMGLILAAADIFLFTSLQDNLPITLQESLAAGTPVVGYATGGAPEIVKAGTSGWLVPTGDEAALGLALRTALTLPEDQRSQVGAAGAADIKARFDMETFISRHIELYRSR